MFGAEVGCSFQNPFECKVLGAIVERQIFWQRRNTAFQRKQLLHHSSLAARHSLPFRLPRFRRLKSALNFFRHQLRTEVRSMVGFCCATNHSCHWLQPMVDDEIFELQIHSDFESF